MSKYLQCQGLLCFISLTIWHSRCRILRLPCKIEASFDVSHTDRALINNVITSYTVNNVQQCRDKCTDDHNDCKSVNHKKLGSDNCQLNSRIKEETKASDFVMKEYWTYYSTNYSTRYVGSYCESFRPCNSTSICFDTCQCPGYQCIHECNDVYFQFITSLCPVSNVALNKPASMSSNFDSINVASNAVDGSLYSSHGTCAFTLMEPTSPWLLVDLLFEYRILYVRVKNRKVYEYAARSQPFDVRVGNNNQTGGISNDFCVQQGSIPTTDTVKRFDCPQGIRGSYVSFHAPPVKSHLDLCELEAYGFRI